MKSQATPQPRAQSRRDFLRSGATLLALGTALSLKAEDGPTSFIEGYAGKVSYAPGEEATLHISTSAPSYTIEITRVGAQDEIVWKSPKPLGGKEYPIPELASSKGCGWPVAVTVKIPAEWRSGYYNVTLRAADRGGKFVRRSSVTALGSCFFVVRAAEPGRKSSILLQLSTNTYNAYNNWGGTSLYAYNGRGGVQGTRVSFERPPASQFSRWEHGFVQWAERNGYELDYAANSDLEFHPEMLAAYKLVLSVGHDEYWSAPMRDHLEAFITRGGNVAFFSGNTCCWQVRSEDKGQALTCFKQNYFVDPMFSAREMAKLSTAWSHHLIKRPENLLTGVGFLWGGYRKSHGQFMDEPAAYKIHRPQHWVFAGTDLTQDAALGAKDTIVGYECDGCELAWDNGLPRPTGRDGTPKDFEVLATCPARWAPGDCEWYDEWEKGRVGNAVMGLYQRGGTVFTTGSTDWAHGLQGNDPAVMRITRNILDRLSK